MKKKENFTLAPVDPMILLNAPVIKPRKVPPKELAFLTDQRGAGELWTEPWVTLRPWGCSKRKSEKQQNEADWRLNY